MTRKLLSVMAVAALLAPALVGVAKAEPWHDHEVRAYHHWHPHGRPVVVESAPAVYAPPVVYAPPPPAPEGINLILPLHFN